MDQDTKGGLSHTKAYLASSSGRYCPQWDSCQERYLSVKSTAVMLDSSEKCIWNLVQRGEIGVTRFGRLVRIPAGELEKMGVFSQSMKESVDELLSR